MNPRKGSCSKPRNHLHSDRNCCLRRDRVSFWEGAQGCNRRLRAYSKPPLNAALVSRIMTHKLQNWWTLLKSSKGTLGARLVQKPSSASFIGLLLKAGPHFLTGSRKQLENWGTSLIFQGQYRITTRGHLVYKDVSHTGKQTYWLQKPSFEPSAFKTRPSKTHRLPSSLIQRTLHK